MNSRTQQEKSKADVDAYLSTIPERFRKSMEELRATIKAAVPEAQEGFSYGVPAFKLGKRPIVCFAAFKQHCGFYPMSPEVLEKFTEELAGYETAKGTIRFSPEKPLPDELIINIVHARIAELAGR